MVVLDDFSTGYRENVVEGARLVEGTILDPVAVDDAFGGVDSVVHLAALGSVPRSIIDPWPPTQQTPPAP